MENIKITGSRGVFFIPSVDFNAETGVCEISGESYLEDTFQFYEPLINWLKKFTAEAKKPILFNIKLTYYNTSTSKYLLDMFDILKIYEDNNGKVALNWYCEAEELKFVEEDVEDYMIQTGLNINIITTN